MNITILVLGFLFGSILQYAKLNRYNVISGMATYSKIMRLRKPLQLQ